MLLAGCSAAVLSGCSGLESGSDRYLVSPEETYEKATGLSYQVTDKSSLYDDEIHVTTMYLTVGRGNAEDGTDYSWELVNATPLSFYEENGISPYKCEAALQVGDEIGPLEGEFGYGELVANATVRLKGEGASTQPQKSYRIDIKDGKGKWKEQKAVVLNKCSGDPLRYSEALCYWIMQDIPEMMSTRTSLVHLYVKDKTEGGDGLFQDYGLYTQVEQINKTWLKNRSLDEDGQLYKAENFDFGVHEDSIKQATDASFDLNAFEQYLEIKGSEDHSKLIAMLKAVNDNTVPIEKVLDQYFDRDNLYYWLAFRILTGCKEEGITAYLYSPQMLDQWYFISRNNDIAFRQLYEEVRDESYETSWNRGIFTFISNSLFARILKSEECRKELDRAVEDLKNNYLTADRILEKAQDYSSIIKPYLYELPDKMYARVTSDTYDVITGRLGSLIEQNYQDYKESLTLPWPFHILEPVNRGSSLQLRWEEAYLFGEEAVSYSVEVSSSYNFTNCLLKNDNVTGTSLEVQLPAPGQYFVRIRAKGGSGTQDAYEYYLTEKDSTIYSTQCFYVLEDGSVAALVYEEGE